MLDNRDHANMATGGALCIAHPDGVRKRLMKVPALACASNVWLKRQELTVYHKFYKTTTGRFLTDSLGVNHMYAHRKETHTV